MQIEVPAIVREMRLADYAPEFGAAVIHVRVNPPLAMLNEFEGALRLSLQMQRALEDPQIEEGRLKEVAETLETAGKALMKFMAYAWSQGPADTRWTEEEIQALVAHSRDTDPLLWGWLVSRTYELIREHRSMVKKA